MIGKATAAAAAIALCSTSALQAAPKACVTSAEMHGMVAYFLPVVLDNVAKNCSAFTPASAYLRAGLPSLQVQLRQGREAAWPMAKSAFFKLGGQKDARTMASLSDDALRPLVDEMLSSKFSIAVDEAKCGEVNDIAEALAPLNAPETVHLIATILSTAARKDNKMSSCPRGI
jgi:hypothetical protein